MTILSSTNGWTIESNFGSTAIEGNVASGSQGLGNSLTFTFTQSPQYFKSVYVQIVPVSGQTGDFWDDFWSQIIGGEPADQFALSTFVNANGGQFAVNINADRFAEGDETFNIFVYQSVTDPGLGIGPLAKASFTVADDDEPGFDKHIFGTDTVDTLNGTAGADIVKAFAGKDILNGLAGNDYLDGGKGADRMRGGVGDDTYFVDNAADVVTELARSGVDTINSAISYILPNFVENLTLMQGRSANAIGNAGANKLVGNDAPNTLKGLAGDDVIIGGAGADSLYGGVGRDTLTGGIGQDSFVFDTIGLGRDLITDFSKAEGDKIVFSKTVYTALGYTGTLKSDDFYAAAGATKAHDASDRLIYDTNTGLLYYDADGQGAGAIAIPIVQLGANAHSALAFADIMITA
jgi:Ca2+-binding RTX toxin-like protein